MPNPLRLKHNLSFPTIRSSYENMVEQNDDFNSRRHMNSMVETEKQEINTVRTNIYDDDILLKTGRTTKDLENPQLVQEKVKRLIHKGKDGSKISGSSNGSSSQNASFL